MNNKDSILFRIVLKVTSAQWVLAVGFMAVFCYCIIQQIDLPDYAVMLGTLIIKSYFDKPRQVDMTNKEIE